MAQSARMIADKKYDWIELAESSWMCVIVQVLARWFLMGFVMGDVLFFLISAAGDRDGLRIRLVSLVCELG